MVVGARESEEVGEGSNKPDSKTRKKQMKKLIAAVAIAAVSGVALADACAPGTVVKTNATVYAVKFALKTPTGDICTAAGTAASNCAPGSNAGANYYVRKPSTYALQGWFADCKDDCDEIKKFTQNHIALWNTKERLGMEVTGYTVDIIHVLSKTQTDAEIYFTLKGDMKNGTTGAWAADGLTRSFDLACAGFGKFDKKNKRYTSFAGNVVGKVSKVMYPKAVNIGTAAAPNWVCPEAGYWLCDAIATGCSGLVTREQSIAYGTFAIKYNAAASTAYYQKGTMPRIPAYVVKPTGW